MTLHLTELPLADGLAPDEYQIFAMCYAQNTGRSVHDAFGFNSNDFHNGPMPLDYFIWIIRNAERVILVDLGFGLETSIARGRKLVHDPVEALAKLGIAAENVQDIVITHMHFDHAGNIARFPNARVHIQDHEVGYVTGRCMHEDNLRFPYDLEDVLAIMRKNWGKQLAFHAGDEGLFLGVTLHHLPGHAPGLQGVRIKTARGQVLLASDASHYYANMYNFAPHRITVSAPDTISSYRKMMALVQGPEFLIPGHDPKVRAVYPKIVVNGIELAVLHETPSETALDYFKSVENFAESYPLEGA